MPPRRCHHVTTVTVREVLLFVVGRYRSGEKGSTALDFGGCHTGPVRVSIYD
jgi:hypothetical protein